MPAYQVTATNDFFFQVLVVKALDRGAAENAFQGYLAADRQQDHEDYEYKQTADLGVEEGQYSAPAERKAYRYAFSGAQIEEISDETCVAKWTVSPSAQVLMVNSGGNG
jgi:hypothetical protein